VEETYEIINQMKLSSSFDIYNINTKILKLAAFDICEALTYLFNKCIDTGIYPKVLKIVKIVPVFKGGETSYKNYRPISIVPTISKIFETFIFRQIYNFFEDNNLFKNNQYGFRKKHCAIDAVQKMTSYCIENIEMENLFALEHLIIQKHLIQLIIKF